MKGYIVRIVLAIMVGMILGYSVAAGPGLYQQILDNRALLDAMATEPAYAVIEQVESNNSRVTVLNVLASSDSAYATVWILHDDMGLAEEGYLEYLIATLADIYQALVDNYPSRRIYAIIVGVVEAAPTIEGSKTQIRGALVYALDAYGVAEFLAAPTGATLDALIPQGRFTFDLIYPQGIFLSEVLPREPGYIWPWPSDDCPLPDDSC